MLKKSIAILLSLSILFCFCACSKSSESTTTATPSESQVETTQNTDTDPNIYIDNNVNVENKIENDNNTTTHNNTTKYTQSTTQKQTTKKQTTTQKQTTNKTQTSHTHSFSSANCTTPKKCYCGATSGSALGHSYSSATCFSAKTCSRCGATSGSALGHNYKSGKCTRCGKTDPNSMPVGLHELFVVDCNGTMGYTYEYSASGITDSFGNSYIGYHFFKTYINSPQYVMYNLNNSFKTLSFDLIAPQSMLSDGIAGLEVYVDNELIYSKNNFKKTSGKTHVSLNVSNGSLLEIKAIRIDGSVNYPVDIALVNAQLTK